ncbi:MAG: DNA-binding response regulator [Methylibium sp.]|nr:DNA-binding response regulator [Methylibium sp.]
MSTALIADDEAVLLEELQALLQETWPELQIVARASTGTEAQRLLQQLRPDIAFLDIRMPGIDGLELARLAPAGTQLVFVTAHAEHALEAFEHAAVDYLHKPVTPARLALTVQRLKSRKAPKAAAAQDGLRFVQAWVGKNLRLLEVERIALLRAELRHTRAISLEGASLLLRTPMGELLDQLDPQLFWQIHRSAVVNVRAIERVERRDDGELWVHGQGLGQGVQVSRSQRGRFKGM